MDKGAEWAEGVESNERKEDRDETESGDLAEDGNAAPMLATCENAASENAELQVC